MRIYLDTADSGEIRELFRWGAFAGITTNPVILQKAGIKPFDAIEKLSPVFTGDFFVQTWGETAEEMERHALEISLKLGKRAIVKVPSTEEGISAISRLSASGVWTAATALFTPSQAILAAEAGANIVIPFYNRIEEDGTDPCETINLIKFACQSRNKAKILVASLKTVKQVERVLGLDVFAITVPPDLARTMIKSPLTDSAVQNFTNAAHVVEE